MPRGVTGMVLLLLIPPTLRAQSTALDSAAESARHAWQAHDVAALVLHSPRVLVQLPGADPSAALGRAQAAALLSDYLETGQEVETALVAAREVEPGRGYVELERRFRVAGTQEIRRQSLLLSYRAEDSRWRLVELRIIGP